MLWIVAIAAFGMALATAGLVAALGPRSEGIPIVAVPQGVSAHEVSGRPIFLLREAGRIAGFLRASPRGHTMLVWCVDEGVFLAPGTGETFDQQGQLLRDFSPRDMDRVRVAVRERDVIVDATDVTLGDSNVDASNSFVRDSQALEEWMKIHNGKQPPVDFCGPAIP